MTKQIRITYSEQIDSKKTPGKILRHKGEQVITKADMTQGLIALMMYAPGSNTQTTNPTLPFAAGDVRQTRSFLRANLGIGAAGNPGDVFELLIDGTVYRSTTRAQLAEAYKLCEMLNVTKRAFYAGNPIPQFVTDDIRNAIAELIADVKNPNPALVALLNPVTQDSNIITEILPLPAVGKKPKAETDDETDDDENVW